MLLNILSWVVFGLIAGAIAQFIMPGKQRGEAYDSKGFVITILLGIAGAVIGGFISSQLFNLDVSGFNLPSFVIAVGGALLLLLLCRLAVSASASRSA